MAATVHTIELSVHQDNRLAFFCTECGNPASIKIDSLKKEIRPLTVRCTCNATFNLDIDHRVYYRKTPIYRGPPGQTCRDTSRSKMYMSSASPGREHVSGYSKNGKATPGINWRSYLISTITKAPRRNEVEVITVDRDCIGSRFSKLKNFEQAPGYYL